MKLKFLSFCLIIALFLPLLSSCGSEETTQREYFIFDTYVTVKITGGDIDHDKIHSGALELLSEIDSALGPENKDGDLYRFNHSEGGIDNAGEHFLSCLTLALSLYERLDGKFNPALGSVTFLYDFDAEVPALPTDDEIEKCLEYTDPGEIEINGNSVFKRNSELMVDLGAIGKGYAAKRLTDYLKSEGVKNAIFSLGGNIGIISEGGEEKKIAVRDPFGEGYSGFFYAGSGYVSVSGDYERYFEIDGVRYHHILNPASGIPARSDVHSVAVWSEDGIFADALSTALFVSAGNDEKFDIDKEDYALIVTKEDGVYSKESKDNSVRTELV